MVTHSPFPAIHSASRRGLRRRGFSLLELTLVIAVLSILVAITWPSLSRPLSRSEVQSAAQRLQQDLLELRLRAMGTGRAQSLVWEVGGDRYWSGPSAILQSTAFRSRTNLAGESSPSDWASADNSESKSTEDFSKAQSSSQASPGSNEDEALNVQACTLPGNVVFGSAVWPAASSPRGAARGSPSAEDDSTSEAAEEKTNQDWAPPITCQPTGRFRSSTLQLRSASGYEVTIHIEGLTGRVRIGQMQRMSRSQDDPLRADASVEEPAVKRNRGSDDENASDFATDETP